MLGSVPKLVGIGEAGLGEGGFHVGQGGFSSPGPLRGWEEFEASGVATARTREAGGGCNLQTHGQIQGGGFWTKSSQTMI